MRAMRSMLAGAAGASLVIAAFAAGAVQPKMAAVPGEVRFTASGDFSARNETGAVLSQIGALDPEYPAWAIAAQDHRHGFRVSPRRAES